MTAGREIFTITAIERAAEQLGKVNGKHPLLGRLKYLRLMNYPSVVPKGRGARSALGMDEMVQILFALELINAGMAPTRAIRVMRTDWTTIKAAIAYGWARKHGNGGKQPYRELVLAPSVLSELGNDDRADEPLHETVGLLDDNEFTKLKNGGNPPRRLLIINTQAFAIALTKLAEPQLGITKDKFAKEFRIFCAEVADDKEEIK